MSSTDVLRETVKKLTETFNDPQRRETLYFDFYDESLRIYGFPPHLSDDKEGLKQFIYILWNAFPDITITFEDVIIEGNKVAGRYRLEGTHKGKFFDLLPTKKQFNVNGTTIFYFQDSKIVKRWNLVDMISLIDQLKTTH